MTRALLVALVLLALPSPASARHHHHRGSHRHHAASYGGGELVEHPAGCPSRLFCGCGAAVKLFGAPIRSLWAAAAWFKFPRAAPAPRMAAVRRHHVFVLLQHIKDDVWLSYDANSGRHATRVHPRSIAGYTIVNPGV